MIEIKDQTLTLKLDKEWSRILTNSLSTYINYKTKNKCNKVDCEDCKRNWHNLLETDIDKLSIEILELYI